MSSGDGDGRHHHDRSRPRTRRPPRRRAARRRARLRPRRPDPLRGQPVAGLLDHLMGLSEGLRASAREGARPGAPQASARHLDPNWRAILPRRLDALVAAWREPAAGEGMTSAGGVEMPAADDRRRDAGRARASTAGTSPGRPGSPTSRTRRTSSAIMPFLERSVPAEGVPGLFGPAVPVPDDAPAFDRALGLSGRDPGWRAPAADRRLTSPALPVDGVAARSAGCRSSGPDSRTSRNGPRARVQAADRAVRLPARVPVEGARHGVGLRHPRPAHSRRAPAAPRPRRRAAGHRARAAPSAARRAACSPRRSPRRPPRRSARPRRTRRSTRPRSRRTRGTRRRPPTAARHASRAAGPVSSAIAAAGTSSA